MSIEDRVIAEQFLQFPGTPVFVCLVTLDDGQKFVGHNASRTAKDDEEARKFAKEMAVGTAKFAAEAAKRREDADKPPPGLGGGPLPYWKNNPDEPDIDRMEADFKAVFGEDEAEDMSSPHLTVMEEAIAVAKGKGFT